MVMSFFFLFAFCKLLSKLKIEKVVLTSQDKAFSTNDMFIHLIGRPADFLKHIRNSYLMCAAAFNFSCKGAPLLVVIYTEEGTAQQTPLRE